MRSYCVVIALAACGKTKAADPSPPAPAAGSASAADRVTPTGVLDFELVERGGHFVLRDAAYEATFPTKPTVEAQPTGAGDVKLLGMSADVVSNDDNLSLIIIPIPPGCRTTSSSGSTALAINRFTT